MPAGATLVDLSGQTLLPGLIDAHTHVLLQGDATSAEYDAQLMGESLPYRTLRATRAMKIALDHGFTTLRDIGNEGAGFADVDLKRAVERGVVEGPRLFVATKALAPTGAYPIQTGAWELSLPRGVEMCDGPDGCRRAVRDQISRGANWIKVYADRSYYKMPDGGIRSLPNFTVEELTAIVDQAHRTRVKVAAHSITPSGHAVALAAGVDSIEHGDVLDDATLQGMASKRVYWCPTLTVMDYVAGPRSKTNPIWGELQQAARDSFKKALAAGRPDRDGDGRGRLPLGRDQPGRGAQALRGARHDALAGAPVRDRDRRRDARAGGQPRHDRARGARRSRRDEGRPAQGHHRDRARLVRDEGGRGGEARGPRKVGSRP